MGTILRQETAAPNFILVSLSSGNTPASDGDAKRLVCFSNLVKVKYIPNLDDLSSEEKRACYWSEREYTISSLALENDVQCALQKKQRQPQTTDGDPTNDPAIHFALPRSRWIRRAFQESGKTAVQMEQRFQRTQQQQQVQYSSRKTVAKNAWNDANIAAAYIPFAIQAQILAYERAVLNAIETNQQLTISNLDAIALASLELCPYVKTHMS